MSYMEFMANFTRSLAVGDTFPYHQDPKTALSEAARNGDADAMKALLDSGVNVEMLINGYADTALICAARNGRTGIVQLLLERGAKVNAGNHPYMMTALHGAAEKGHVATVKVLLEFGANRKARDRWKQTALTLATENGHWEVVDLLEDNANNH